MKLPKPHAPENPKAFLLGCDPTAFDKYGNRLEFEFVFDIDKDNDNDKRYFSGILSNLNSLGLGLIDVYVQNMVTEYLEKETSKNKMVWKEKARESIAKRKIEFDLKDPSRELPVFLTSYLLYDALLNEDSPRKTASELYAENEIIHASKNKLGRPLVPFFRHYIYGYKEKVDYFKNVAGLFKP